MKYLLTLGMIIQNLYWQQTACIWIGNELSKYRKLEKGCIFLQNLFTLQNEAILRILEVQPRFILAATVTNIKTEDDTVLLEDTEWKL